MVYGLYFVGHETIGQAFKNVLLKLSTIKILSAIEI